MITEEKFQSFREHFSESVAVIAGAWERGIERAEALKAIADDTEFGASFAAFVFMELNERNPGMAVEFAAHLAAEQLTRYEPLLIAEEIQ